jgi:hypothetical protein
MTAIGGEAITGAIEDSAALLGYEASRTEPPAGNVEFVDYPFNSDETTGDRIDLLEAAVRKHQPRLAVGPDIEGPIDMDTAATVGDRLLEAGADDVVLVPKDVGPAEVPERFRVGFPAASFGTGSTRLISEYAAVPADQGVHILGGSPTLQLELAEYGLPVRSVDGSGIQRGAEFYDVWTPDEPNWEKAPGSDLYDRIRVSLDNVAIAWADRRGTPRPAPEIVTGEQLASRGVDPDAIDAEVRRRNAGRGPPVADPDTGEIDEAIDVRGTTLNAHDERVTAALERLAESDRPESVAVDVDPIEELDDEQETLQL